MLSPRSPVDFKRVETPRNDEVKAQETAEPETSISFFTLFRYADRTDYMLMAAGGVAAAVIGVSLSLELVLFGDALNGLSTSSESISSQVRPTVVKYALFGVLVLVAGFVQMTCWSLAGARQVKRIRSAYAHAILTKEIAWFDMNEPMELNARAAGALVTIQDAIGSRMGDSIRYTALIISGLIIGLVKGWQLALVMLAFMPFIALSMYFSSAALSKATKVNVEAQGAAGAVAQEALSNIRTVHMFNGIQHTLEKFDKVLDKLTKSGIMKALAAGWGNGAVYFCMPCVYAGGLYFGAWKISSDLLDGHDVECTFNGGDKSCYDGGQIITVFFSIVMAGFTIGMAGPCIQAVFSARAAAASIFSTIDRESLIDPTSSAGKTLDHVEGAIEIRDVTFAYPSRPDVLVCKKYSLIIQPGETVALVGPSGSGKSTIVGLLERFYDPLAGAVLLDGHNISDLNVNWLRQQIALVGQEPALFAMSIMDNIRHGRPGATDDEVIEAAKMANAYDFIMDFPDKFDTPVGERGAQLSGGQKQRIAIARAIIKNPRILLLDEATSALDTQSERIVQQSLDKLLASSTQRTTILVAHRLSTVRNATRIAVHHEGSIVELGPHDELMKIPNGHYQTLVNAQNRAQDTEAGTAGMSNPGESLEVDETSIPVVLRHSSKRLSSRHSKMEVKEDHSSTTSDDESGEGDDRAPKHKVPVGRLWKMTLIEWKFVLVGFISSLITGAAYPVVGLVFGQIMALLFRYDYTSSEMMSRASTWAVRCFLLGVLFGVTLTTQHYSFGVTSQRLIARVRRSTFAAMLRQEIAWFDLPQHASGALVGRITSDTDVLQTVTSDVLNQQLTSGVTMVVALLISFFYSWQLTLGAIATLPFMIFNGYIEGQQMEGSFNSKKLNDADAKADAILSEAISSIRTTASFGMETSVSNIYAELLDTSNRADVRVGIITGISYGAAQAILFWTTAFVFWLGGVMMTKGELSFTDFNVVQSVVMMASWSLASTSQNKTGKSKVAKAAHFLFSTIDRVPPIDATSTAGLKLDALRGDLVFENVSFAYPTRPDKQVYSRYNLTIKSGQTVALVGASGSGKSTAISLLERFYDPNAGRVTLDGVDLRELNLPWVRDRISLVSQEPVLFSGTIGENIAMGKPGATREEVIEAAKQANAYDFISNFPDGLDTQVGDRGAQVSGGQKQRIAIARAILRDPDVLLLDEATSALDNESERVVQASLDSLMAAKKRTTVVVAHRLSTIQRADLICVTQDGVIVEQGTHAELMRLSDGLYRSLVANQLQAAH